MKSLRFVLIAVFAIAASPLLAQQSTPSQKDTIQVQGECGMCKSRIQKALKVDGISTATWDTETKLLTVTYDPKIISNDDIQKKVAAVGHDTEKYRADDKVYNKLHGCCQYERKKVEAKPDPSQHHK